MVVSQGATSTVKLILSSLTLLSDAVIGLLLIFLILKYMLKVKNISLVDSIGKLLKSRILLIAFIVAVVATSGSLFFSELAGWEPCKLCWLQRIFMYPMVVLLGVALIKKARDIADYAIPMAIIGSIVAIYHYTIQVTNYVSSCASDGASCSTRYIWDLGYISIPMMALTAFILIIILTYYWKKDNK